ncbi:MAG: molybdopterin molybdotransferase MoeA [Alphaproteobacteria bacterium]|nr:molybdopterin molybdotransferase MoeA [Alphaproteobacteria bacterium]
MLTVTEALNKITDLFTPLPMELVPLHQASGRVLAEDVITKRNQPPFAASSMDGYGVANDALTPGAEFTVIGESAAGSGFDGSVGAGQAVRIFTGAPVPEGVDRVVMQEDVLRLENVITIGQEVESAHFIRPAGDDFSAGDGISAPRRLTPADIALLAAMNISEVPVRRKPVVALLATGDELVMPGEVPGPDQIIASNNFGLAALLEAQGAEIRMLPIAKDTAQSLTLALKLARGADLIVTIGGASVGDHDIVQSVASDLGLKTAFYKVAMRPGKPLMAGKIDETPMIGLPGNPVSSMVCGHIFLRPALNVMLGLGDHPLPRELARLGSDMGPNGGREHYMRASLGVEYGQLTIHPADRQDSALLSVLAKSNALLVRPPNDPARKSGEMVEVIRTT